VRAAGPETFRKAPGGQYSDSGRSDLKERQTDGTDDMLLASGTPAVLKAVNQLVKYPCNPGAQLGFYLARLFT
jgi:hypothetical protein